MREKKMFRYIALAVLVFFSVPTPVLANKSSVTIDVPEAVEKGEEITIKINVSHSANNIFHYTNWVYVMANGIEIKRWKYRSFGKPEGKNFSLEINYTVMTVPLEIVAEANCNMHGSAGRATAILSPK